MVECKKCVDCCEPFMADGAEIERCVDCSFSFQRGYEKGVADERARVVVLIKKNRQTHFPADVVDLIESPEVANGK